MVFRTLLNLLPLRHSPRGRQQRGPHQYWRRRQVFRQTDHFYGRARNFFSVAIRALEKRWERESYKEDPGRRKEIKELQEIRLEAACNEHGTNCATFLEGLAKCNILLDRHILTDLAMTEPRSFKCLVIIALDEQNWVLPEDVKTDLGPGDGFEPISK